MPPSPHVRRCQTRRVACVAALPLLLTAATPLVGGCAAAVTCTQTADTPTGLSISHGLITGTMTLACTGTPDSFDFTLILVRDGAMQKPGAHYTRIPGPAGYTASTFAPCTPGAWHLYYLVTWTYRGQVTHNPNTTLADKTVVLDDC